MKQLIFTLLFFGASSVYSWDFLCSNDGLGAGPYVGGNGSLGIFEFQFEERLFQDNADQELNIFHSDIHQIAEGGGIFIGYGMPFCKRFRVALQFNGNWYGNEARHSFNYADVGENFIQRTKCKALYDLSILPAVTIGECLLFSFKAGVSWAGLRRHSIILEDDAPNPIDDRKTKRFYQIGYVVGVNVQLAITNKFSAFAGYDWHRFSPSKILVTDDIVGATLVTNTSKLTRLTASLFNFGAAYKF